MLELKDVHTHYGLSHVLQGISLSVGSGEVVGLFGRNGVGKTTVIKTIAGWVRPSRGALHFDGEDMTGAAPEQVCRRGIGLVPEDRRIFPGLTVEENLKLGLLQAPRRSRAESRSKLEQIYQRFPRLAERRRQMGTTLSGGEQQMLAMARVLAGAPKLLLIDEPTEGLAPMIVDELFELMAGLARDGIPIVLVEQNVQRAIALTQRYYLIERGQVTAQGDSTNAAHRADLLEKLSV
ncbi:MULTISPECIES: ABC transporter ATP-binding protein [Roseateles]|uniref:ABC transporter ATP-binding protein n=1 Tax=Roseateles puraquae TaxID=431059 RepID=A0A254N448_9BURK|nr:ABC transporter ATP-binding protein [Roseateles puraquae]MDG0853822.1 ABC transporter ATP-binding protein [Roseateles puraquae]OWR02859.1 ABC transporter ATP-binding protein [Roseateles puraquae]RTL22518.1 MAG: ABC transporter ATP-binding protein [Burkholderiales bacterium]